MAEPPPANACPLCHRPNQCALALPEGERPAECWCMKRSFPPALLERSDPRACICAACLDAAERTREEP